MIDYFVVNHGYGRPGSNSRSIVLPCVSSEHYSGSQPMTAVPSICLMLKYQSILESHFCMRG